MSVSTLRLGKFSAIMFTNMFSAPAPLSLPFLGPWDPYHVNASMLDVVSEVS